MRGVSTCELSKWPDISRGIESHFAMVLDIIVVIDSQNAGILGDSIVLVF